MTEAFGRNDASEQKLTSSRAVTTYYTIAPITYHNPTSGNNKVIYILKELHLFSFSIYKHDNDLAK